MKLSKQQRVELRMKFGGKCAYCGCDLPERGWHADHVEPVLREWWKRLPKVSWDVIDGQIVKTEEKQKIGMLRANNDVLDNLFPSCVPCNIDKHCMSLESWRGIIADKVRVLRDNYKAFGHAERFGLVQEIKKPVVFWFEEYAALACVQEGEKAMTPVFQDKADNCFQACVASIMDLLLAEVPHFQEGVMAQADHTWTQERWDAVVKFAEDHGYEAFWLDPDLESDRALIPLLHASEMFYLVTGKSHLGKFGHCVVWHKGQIVHDPNRYGRGIEGDPWLYIAFERSGLSSHKKESE